MNMTRSESETEAAEPILSDASATYSPEDNKLRLYPLSRLPRDLYDRVKAAGFKWAPKQELFVAPMWTPGREDLLIELVGEIGDEDKSLVERAAERADRFEDYSDNRRADAESARKAVSAIADNIPLGQPILVGHHSERHARRDAEKIENGMRRAVRMWDVAEYWTRRAAGALHAAKYKEQPAVRARRIRGLEADRRKQERAKAEAEGLIRFWSGKAFAKSQAGERKPIEITEENRAFLRDLLGRMSASGVQFRGKDGENWYSAWDVLQTDGERYKNCPEKTVAEIQEAALRLQAAAVARAERWIAHYDNRLAYERAMMAEGPGLATDTTGPEKGGGCRCWASPRGGWSFIQKVNRISVTVLDNWGNGGKNFTRTIPFDKLARVLSAAEVERARSEGRLFETPDKTGFILNEQEPAAVVTAPAEKQEPEPEEEGIEAMRESLKAGVKVVTAPQLFPTPPDLAQRLVAAADIRPGMTILEPSVGTGALMVALDGKQAVMIEINRELAEQAGRRFRGEVICADFLEWNGREFDRIIMNPPFGGGADIKHIEHAITLLAPGGKLVALCANGPRQQAKLKPQALRWFDLEPGSFAPAGTNVNVAMLVYQR